METKRKGKRRNSDKRKEKSRDAARSRRSLETEVFSALASALPLPSGIAAQLDKASIMRLAIAHLKLRSLVSSATADGDTALVPKADDLGDRLHMRALSGFLFVVSAEGDFVFLSENIQEHLGIPQLELMGQSVYEFSHPCDHDELRTLLSERTARGQPCSFFLRLKSTLTSKGRSVNLKSASYKVIHCTGRALGAEPRCLVGIGAPIPHPSNIEVPLDRQAFLSKHSLDMRFTYADDKIGDFLGYSASDLIGKSIYEYFHAEDSACVERDFKSLLAKGQRETTRYRFLAARGGYVWVVTQATLIHAAKGHKPISVVCVNYVISGIERQHEVYACHQLTALPTLEVTAPPPAQVAPALGGSPVCRPRPRAVTASLIRAAPPPPAKLAQPEPLPTYPRTVTAQLFAPRPQLATSKVFAPRTADMSKGFLMFADDDTGLTTLKDEPEDLTHLAPTAGDVCVPLMADLLDDFMLYGGGCGDVDNDADVRGLTDASQEAMARGARDPFLSYRADETPPPTLSSVSSASSLSSGSHYLQAADLDRSPCASSLPSLCSPAPPDDRLLSEADEELSMRAPYIPMDEGDDLPLLVSDLMWGPLMPGEPPRASCLEELLCEDSKPAPSRPCMESLTPPMVSLDWTGCGPTPHDTGPGLGRESPGPGGGGGGSSGGGTQRGKRGWPDPDPGGDVKRQRHSELRRHLTGTVTPPPTPPATSASTAPSASVLMNLLVSGCDLGLGSVPRGLHKSPALLDPDTIMTLAALSARDCAVNAPLETHSRLLQGQDLLTALEATALE